MNFERKRQEERNGLIVHFQYLIISRRKNSETLDLVKYFNEIRDFSKIS